MTDVATDIRKSSPTFDTWADEVLSAENKRQMWIPEGFGHGFVVLTDAAEFHHETTDYWAQELERCNVRDYTSYGLNWHTQDEPVLSGKDAQGAAFKTAEVFA